MPTTRRQPKPRATRLTAMSPEILDVRGAAELLGVSPRTVYKLVADGVLPGAKVGKEWRFARKRLIEWVAAGGKADGGEGSLAEMLRSQKVRSARRV